MPWTIKMFAEPVGEAVGDAEAAVVLLDVELEHVGAGRFASVAISAVLFVTVSCQGGFAGIPSCAVSPSRRPPKASRSGN